MIRSPYAPLRRKRFYPIANCTILCENVNYNFSIQRGRVKARSPIVLWYHRNHHRHRHHHHCRHRHRNIIQGLYLCERKTHVLCAVTFECLKQCVIAKAWNDSFFLRVHQHYRLKRVLNVGRIIVRSVELI